MIELNTIRSRASLLSAPAIDFSKALIYASRRSKKQEPKVLQAAKCVGDA